MQLNPHYAELNESYLFSTIAHKVADYRTPTSSVWASATSPYRWRHP